MQPEKVVDACECCAEPAIIAPPHFSEERVALIREAFRLERLTIGWMTVEAVVAIAAGVAAGSLVLSCGRPAFRPGRLCHGRGYLEPCDSTGGSLLVARVNRRSDRHSSHALSRAAQNRHR